MVSGRVNLLIILRGTRFRRSRGPLAAQSPTRGGGPRHGAAHGRRAAGPSRKKRVCRWLRRGWARKGASSRWPRLECVLRPLLPRGQAVAREGAGSLNFGRKGKMSGKMHGDAVSSLSASPVASLGRASGLSATSVEYPGTPDWVGPRG